MKVEWLGKRPTLKIIETRERASLSIWEYLSRMSEKIKK
jgi:hypothetical protein